MGGALPPVTIGIPFFNAESTLLDAVRSVFAQTHQDWELLLVDDGSTDGSLALAQSIDDPRVTVYSDGCNKRLAARLNEIVRWAKFDYVARMDADDLMSCDRIERQLRILVESDATDIVSAGVVSLSDGFHATGMRCMPQGHAVRPELVLAGRSGIVHAAVLARRAWFLRNPYDEALVVSQDTDLWIRACAKADLRVEVLPLPLYYYREDGNVTYAKLRQAYATHRRAIRFASSGYRLSARLRAYAVSVAKSAGAFVAHRLGRMDLIRRRRNTTSLTTDQQSRFDLEIKAILDTPLPIRIESRTAHDH